MSVLADVLALEATPAIDIFNYTNNPISAHDGSWTDHVLSGDIDLQTNGASALATAVATAASAYKNALTYGPNMGVMATLVAKNSSGDGLVGLYIGLQSSPFNGFRGEIRIRTTTDEFRVQRLDGGVEAQISTGTLQEVAANDKLAVFRDGGNIDVWWKTGSTWTKMITIAANTSGTAHSGTGRIGIEILDQGTLGNALGDLKAANMGAAAVRQAAYLAAMHRGA